MSNLHGILNNLVNELTESTWNITPNENDMQAVRAAMQDQEAAKQQARLEYEHKLQTARNEIAAANRQFDTDLKYGQLDPATAEAYKHSQENQAEHAAQMQRLEPSLMDQARFYSNRVGRDISDAYNAAKAEVSANPWLYGGLGAAALASGAGALALRKRLAKIKCGYKNGKPSWLFSRAW